MQVNNINISFKANKMSTMQANYVDKKLREAKHVDIICHNLTDRDCANSALAMWEYLNNIGVNARVVMSQKDPKSLGLRTYDFNMVQASNDTELKNVKPDIAFCVDFGGEERVLPNVLEHIKKTPIIMGFDHHSETDIANGSFMQLQRALSEDEYICSKVDFYSDMTAKSATSVIYRFLEANGKEIDSSTAYDLFFGLTDDILKRNLVKVDGEKGTITAQKDLIEDKNVYEVFNSLKAKLSDEQIAKIAKTIDVLSSLNPEQQAFKDSLNDRLKYSNNGKIAYVEISPDDEQWKKLGGDNTVTSRILNNFRQEILAQNKEVKVAITFYEAHGNYRLSAHARDPQLLSFFKYVEQNKIRNFTKNSGGHPTRAGGGINSSKLDACRKWVQDIVSCDDFFQE